MQNAMTDTDIKLLLYYYDLLPEEEQQKNKSLYEEFKKVRCE